MYQLSIIIPCYNEENSIKNLVERCFFITKDRNDIQFIFVNNGSTDKTAIRLHESISALNFTNGRIVEVPINNGYGYGIKSGLEASNSQILAWTHADLQTDPIDVVNAFDLNNYELFNTNCLIKGIRKNRPFFDNIFTIGMSIFSSILLKKMLWDINAQPKILNKKFLKYLKYSPDDFSLDLYILYIAAVENVKIKTFPVFFNKRNYDEAKGGGTFKGKFKLIIRTVFYIFELKKRSSKNKKFAF